MYLLYCGLLVIWVPLLWPAFHLKGGVRLWLIIVIVAGAAALAHEVRMYLWSNASIRFDILLISVALVCLYGSAAVLLFFAHWLRAAALLAIVLALIGGGMGYKWIEVGRESQRLGEAFRESNRLLFRAKFGSPEIYERHFGPFNAASDDHPIGHWRIEGRSHYTRLIINAQGRVWLFYQCQDDAECHSGPEGSGLRKSANASRHWEASLKPPAGLPFDITISQTEPGSLLVAVREQELRFVKAPPPVNPAPTPNSLQFLGPFANIECSGAHAKIRQVWLWQDGDRLYAVGTLSTLVAGRQNDFVPAIVMGEGLRQNGGWRFAWQQHGRSGTAIIMLKEGDAILTFDLGDRDLEDADQLVLKGNGVFSDERVELAPLTSGSDWRHWFDTVLVGHFISGLVPAC